MKKTWLKKIESKFIKQLKEDTDVIVFHKKQTNMNPPRPAPFGIRLNPNTKLLLEKKAKLKGIKLHAYCKDVLTKHADRK